MCQYKKNEIVSKDRGNSRERESSNFLLEIKCWMLKGFLLLDIPSTLIDTQLIIFSSLRCTNTNKLFSNPGCSTRLNHVMHSMNDICFVNQAYNIIGTINTNLRISVKSNAPMVAENYIKCKGSSLYSYTVFPMGKISANS